MSDNAGGVTKVYADRPGVNMWASLGFDTPFRHAVRTGQLVHTTGQLSLDVDGHPLHERDLEAQTRVVMRHIESVLGAVGARLQDVLRTNCYVVGFEGLEEAHRLLASFFDEGVVSTTTIVDSLAAPGCRIEIEAVALAGGSKQFAHPVDHYPHLGGPSFYHGVRADGMVYVGGQLAIDSEGRVLHPGDKARQTYVVMENVSRVLEELGSGIDDVVKMTTYQVGAEGWMGASEIRGGFFKNGPTSTAVVVHSLERPGLMIEVEVVAIVGRNKQWIDPPGIHRPFAPSAPFRHGVRCGDLIYVTGQVDSDEGGRIRNPGNLVAQVRGAMGNVGRVLDAVGASFADVIKTNTFYVDEGLEDWKEPIEVRASYIKEGPTVTGVAVESLLTKNALIEIEAIAFSPRAG